MITKDQIVPLLLDKCPEFGPTWKEHTAFWQGEPAGLFNDASAFVEFLIESYERDQDEILRRAFAAIEEFIVHGDDDVRGVAIVGHLETLQNRASWQTFGSKAFVRYLLPHSRAAWHEIHKWWAGGKSLMDIIREERAGQGAGPNFRPATTSDPSGFTGNPPLEE